MYEGSQNTESLDTLVSNVPRTNDPLTFESVSQGRSRAYIASLIPHHHYNASDYFQNYQRMLPKTTGSGSDYDNPHLATSVASSIAEPNSALSLESPITTLPITAVLGPAGRPSSPRVSDGTEDVANLSDPESIGQPDSEGDRRSRKLCRSSGTDR